jgi:fructose-1,6-bisphosphatase/sedoheptulose 1,7-bisphosphatase-like protein
MIIGNGFVDLFVKTTSEAAYASSLLKGKGDKIAADQAAVDKMRERWMRHRCFILMNLLVLELVKN